MHIPEKILKMQKVLHRLSDFEKILDIELEKLKGRMTSLNKRQLARGESSSARFPISGIYKLEPDGHSEWVDEKTSEGVPYDWGIFPFVNLRGLTGHFYAGFFVTITKNEVIINSSDVKRDKLVKRYGEKIFGLNEKNLDILIKDLRKNTLEYVRKQLNNV